MAVNRQNQHYIRYADPNIFYHEELAQLKVLVRIPNRAADACARIQTIMMNPTMPIIYRAHCHLALAVEEGPYRVYHANSAKKLIEYMLGYGPHCAEYHEMMKSANQMLAIAPVQREQENNKNHDINNKKSSGEVIVIDDAAAAETSAPESSQQVEQAAAVPQHTARSTEPQKSNLKRTSTDLVDDDETDDDAEQSVVTKKPKPVAEPTKKKLTVTFKLPVHSDKPVKPVGTTIAKSITTTFKSVKPVKPAKPVKPLRVGDRKSARLSMLAVDRRAVKYDKPTPEDQGETNEATAAKQDATVGEKNDNEVHNTDTDTASTSSNEWEIVNVKAGANDNEVVVDNDEDDGDTTEEDMSFEDLVDLRLAEEEEERLLAAQFGRSKGHAIKIDDAE